MDFQTSSHCVVKMSKPRELNDEDKKALGQFITGCFNLNDGIDKYQSTWAQYGFETACDYLRTEKIDKLEAALKEAAQTLEWIQSGVSGMFNDGEDKDKLIFDQAARTVARIEEVLK